MVLAIRRLAGALDARIDIEWIPRCSNDGSLIADLLSKGQFSLACSKTNAKNLVIGRYSSTLRAFSANLRETRVLGQAMAREASAFMTTLPTSVERIAEVEELYREYVPVK